MASFLSDLDSLCTLLGDDAPSGPDLVYDPVFLAMEAAAAERPERQYGEKTYAPEPPDWLAVQEQALALAARSRDLRVAVLLARSGARLQGLEGFVAGLKLVQRLLQTQWPSVHPQLDASDHNDATMRLNALAPLAFPTAALADLRAASLAPERGSVTVRDIELAFANAPAAPGETVPTQAGLTPVLAALLQRHAHLGSLVAEAQQAVRSINDTVAQQAPAVAAPDLAPLQRLLDLMSTTIARAGGEVASAQDAATLTATSAVSTTSRATAAAAENSAAGIHSRQDAARELDRICDWLEQHEPGHPAPLLIRRAQRLLDKTFLDIIRDLAPDTLAQFEHLAGTEASA